MSYEVAVANMQAGDVYEKSAMDSLDLIIANGRFQPDVLAIVYALLSIRSTMKADSEMRMDNR